MDTTNDIERQLLWFKDMHEIQVLKARYSELCDRAIRLKDVTAAVALADLFTEDAIVDMGAPLIPVGQLSARIGEITLPKDTEIIVHCKSGGRSQTAAKTLVANGFTNVKNLAGGITAWADRIDKSLPKY